MVSMVDDEELRLFHSLPRRLHHGEAACLGIARRRNWAFLTNDKLAHRTGRMYGITVSGTLGVLVQGIERAFVMVEGEDELLRERIDRGYRSPHATLQRFLESACQARNELTRYVSEGVELPL
jgi:predicted nucleic acid-binding protein